MRKDTVLDRMREEGLRLTPQRVQIVELLLQLSHPTADRIYARMAEHFPYVSQATVYSTLRKLKEIGVVSELAGDKSSHFEVIGSEHWHFNCKVCGEKYDLESQATEALMAAASKNGAFQVDACRVDFYGVCERCRG